MEPTTRSKTSLSFLLNDTDTDPTPSPSSSPSSLRPNPHNPLTTTDGRQTRRRLRGAHTSHGGNQAEAGPSRAARLGRNVATSDSTSPQIIDLTDTSVNSPRPNSSEVVEILSDDDDDVVVTRVVERAGSAGRSTGGSAVSSVDARSSERRRRRREFAGLVNAILTAAHHHHHHHFHPYPRHGPTAPTTSISSASSSSSSTATFLPPTFIPAAVAPPTTTTTRKPPGPKASKAARPGFTRSIVAEDATDQRDPACPVCRAALREKEMWAIRSCGHVVCGGCVEEVRTGGICVVCEKKVRKGGAGFVQLFV